MLGRWWWWTIDNNHLDNSSNNFNWMVNHLEQGQRDNRDHVCDRKRNYDAFGRIQHFRFRFESFHNYKLRRDPNWPD